MPRLILLCLGVALAGQATAAPGPARASLRRALDAAAPGAWVHEIAEDARTPRAPLSMSVDDHPDGVQVVHFAMAVPGGRRVAALARQLPPAGGGMPPAADRAVETRHRAALRFIADALPGTYVRPGSPATTAADWFQGAVGAIAKVTEPGRAELYHAAGRGMVAALKERYSLYLRPEKLVQLIASLRAGAEVPAGALLQETHDGKSARVAFVHPISPASRAGLVPGDVLLAIDGRTPASPVEANALFHGVPGARSRLRIQRREQQLEVDLDRTPFTPEQLYADVDASGIATVTLPAFNEGAAAAVRDRLADLERQAGPLKGLILDLSGNPGGLTPERIALSSLFMEGSLGRFREVAADGMGLVETVTAAVPSLLTYPHLPLVVLVDGHSASATESLAAAVSRRGRGFVLGKGPTYGKGRQQTVLPLPNGAGLQLTTAELLPPDGDGWDGEGLQPDHVLDESADPVEFARGALEHAARRSSQAR